MPDEIDDKTKRKIVEEYTKRGREVLKSGPSLRHSGGITPYSEIARKIFDVEPLQQGALPIYDNICEKCGKFLGVSDIIQDHEHTEEECMLYRVHNS
jgi:hypothetical protein